MNDVKTTQQRLVYNVQPVTCTLVLVIMQMFTFSYSETNNPSVNRN